jgi:wyosine [tRNA(Phe)-imidazoG37] synthetase (radical SAM superfamily)
MFLWNKIAFGPVQSRRLGSSLGINILPTTVKVCSFDCIYCECGWTLDKSVDFTLFNTANEIIAAIEAKFCQSKKENIHIDSITFSGNGEPTLHPEFNEIIDSLIVIRNKYYSETEIACLSNATQLNNLKVLSALKKMENPILKLDAVTESLFQLINKPTTPISVSEIIEHLQQFHGDFILQSLFFKGEIEGQCFNNAAEPHLSMWINIVKLLHPKKVMIYSLDRTTPAHNIEKIPVAQLQEIVRQLQAVGISAEAY